MAKYVIHSLCASACVPLIAKKCCCLRVSSALRICVHCKTPFYIAPPFPVTPTLMATVCLSFWTSWYWYHYWLCRVPVNALLSHYDPRKIVDLFMVTWRLLGFFADLGQHCRTLVTSSSLPTVVCVCVEDRYTTQTILKPSGPFYKRLAGFKAGWPDLIPYVHPGPF